MNISKSFHTFIQNKIKPSEYHLHNSLVAFDLALDNKERISYSEEPFSYLNQNVFHMNNSESLCYLFLQNYDFGHVFLPYIRQRTEIEGWKLHIPIASYEEYLFVIQYFSPELQLLNIDHKIIRPDLLEAFNNRNSHENQTGKSLTIYIEHIENLLRVSPLIQEYLLMPTTIDVSTDIHIGGKVFARYCGFSNDLVTNPTTGEKVYIPRKKGFYKPEWISEPLSIDNLFKKNKE